MIWYTYLANTNVIQNQFVQLSSDGLSVELHTTGTPLGVCMGVETLEDTQETTARIYVAGGSGNNAVLYASWNGEQSRFEVINGKVNPVSSGGVGWLIPSFPKTNYSANDVVKVAIY
jgi:hypothetical protein